MFAARAFATLGFAQKASFVADGAASAQGKAACAARGQIIREGSASTLGFAQLLARTNPWRNSTMWAQAYATAQMHSSAILAADLRASGVAVTSLKAGYTWPTHMQANGNSSMSAQGIQVLHGIFNANARSSMLASGQLARQASARADGVGSMRATGARKIGGGIDARGIAGFVAYSATVQRGESIMDATGRAIARFDFEALQSSLTSMDGASAFDAAGMALAQAGLVAQGFTTANIVGSSYATMFSIMAGIARTKFEVQPAGFKIADLVAAGASWTNFRTAIAKNGGAYMAGNSTADFHTEYAAVLAAAMHAAGTANTSLDGFRRIFVMASASASGAAHTDVEASAIASTEFMANGLSHGHAHGISIHNVLAYMQSDSRLLWDVGNPIFQFLPPANEATVRPFEARHAARAFEQRKVQR